jgi:hypothetical protein
MPDGFFFKDPREARTPFNDNYVVIGIVGVCALRALALLVAGMLDPVGKNTAQPRVTTQSDSQAPAITQPSTQPPATGETKTP